MKHSIWLFVIAAIFVIPRETKAQDAHPGQKAIVALLSEYSARYAKATHDLKRTDVRKERAVALCAKLRELAAGGDIYTIRGWRGRLERLVERLGGSYTMKIELEDRSILKKLFSGEPPLLYATISSSSKLLGHLVNVPVGTMIEVEGKLKADRTDCIADASLTERGMIEEPELKFEPSSINTAHEVDREIELALSQMEAEAKRTLPRKFSDTITLVEISHRGKTFIWEFEIDTDHFQPPSTFFNEVGKSFSSNCPSKLPGLRVRVVYRDSKQEQIALFEGDCR